MVALLLMRVAVLFLVSDDKKKHHNGDGEVETMLMLKKSDERILFRGEKD